MEANFEPTTSPHYDLTLWVDPPAQQVRVSGSLVYHAPAQGAALARFALNPALNVRTCSGRRVSGYHFERAPQTAAQSALQPELGTLDVHFDPPLPANAATLIEFVIEGRLSGLPSRDWVQLSRAWAWLPLLQTTDADHPASTDQSLTFTIQVTCPPGYAAASLGQASHAGDGWRFDWPHPTGDLPVLVARGLQAHCYESETHRVNLYSTTLTQASADQLGEDALWAIERFAGWFGPVRPAEFTIIQSPGEADRPPTSSGLCLLGSLSTADVHAARARHLHEMAYLAAQTWWGGSASPVPSDPALHASFAEYSALLAVRDRCGLPDFDAAMAAKRQQVAELLPGGQPMWGFAPASASQERASAQWQAQALAKGPLLLHQLSERIGQRRFFDLCRAMQWSDAGQSGHVLDLLEELEDAPTRQWLEARLTGQAALEDEDHAA